MIGHDFPAEDLAHAYRCVGSDSWHRLRGARIFLAGGTGFVGKWLIATLLDANLRLNLGCELVVLSRDPEAFFKAQPFLAGADNVQLVQGDVRRFDFPDGDFSHVIHAAADVVVQASAREVFATCVEGTGRILELTTRSNTSQFLLVSSGAVYGRQPTTLERLREDYVGAPDTLNPASAYGEGKRVAEWLSVLQGADSSMQVKIARCFAFVGPHLPLDKHFAIGNFLRDAMAGKEIVIRGDGTPLRTYLHAADMAAWLWAVLLRGQHGTAYNVGGEEIVSIASLAQRVTQVVGSSAGVTTMQKAPQSRLPEGYVPDVTRARAQLDLPDPISLDEAILRTARWHRHSTTTT